MFAHKKALFLICIWRRLRKFFPYQRNSSSSPSGLVSQHFLVQFWPLKAHSFAHGLQSIFWFNYRADLPNKVMPSVAKSWRLMFQLRVDISNGVFSVLIGRNSMRDYSVKASCAIFPIASIFSSRRCWLAGKRCRNNFMQGTWCVCCFR